MAAARMTRNFDHYPSLEDLLRRSNEKAGKGLAGMPGYSYGIFAANEAHLAQEDGWNRITNMPVFTINDTPCELMARGEPITGLNLGDIKCDLSYSASLEVLTEIPLGELANDFKPETATESLGAN